MESKAVQNTNRFFKFWFWLTLTCILFSIFYAYPVWLSPGKEIPQTPLLALMPVLPKSVYFCILALMVGCIALLFRYPRQRYFSLIVAICIFVFMLSDQIVLQPYFYMYGFSLLAIGLYPSIFDQENNRWPLRIMVAGAYLWSGIQKLNLVFFQKIFPWFVVNTIPFPELTTEIAPFICIFESLIGIFLLIPYYWRTAQIMASLMLATVLLSLGPIGHNWNVIVWPWNLWLFVTVLALFPAEQPPPIPFLKQIQQKPLFVISCILFLLLPGLGYFGLWPPYMSFQLYSGTVSQGQILLARDENIDSFPDYLKNHYDPATHLVDLSRVIMDRYRLGTSSMQNDFRLIEHMGASLCPLLKYPQKATLQISLPERWSTEEKIINRPLCRENSK